MKLKLFVAGVLCAALTGALVVWTPVVRGISTSIVISEFRVRGPNGGSDEFVELYNVSSAAVNIGGWKIRGSNAAGTASTRLTIAAGTMLPPGCHFLAVNVNVSGGPYSGPTPSNQGYTTGITDDGGIAVTLPNDMVVDQVGMSSGSAYKEGMVLASLGSSNLNRGYERKPGGAAGSGQDTDNNAADFQLVTPNMPENLASACIVAGNPTSPSGTGSATPPTAGPGDSTLLTVAVAPGSNPTSTSITVTAELSTIGGSMAQPLFDDATNGDTMASDNTFSYLATVGAGTTPGAKSLPVTITDAQSRTGNTNIALAVLAPLVAIHDIQGPGNVSPHVNQPVRTRGIVTGRKSNGFFIQTSDTDADGLPETSQGIFVFTLSAPPADAAVGNEVEVNGTAREFVPTADPSSPPMTEISGLPSVTLHSSGNPLPGAVTLTAADTTPSGSIEQLEKFEGMRVHVDSLMVVAPTQGFISEANATATTNGAFFGVISGLARPFREPGIEIPDPLPPGAPCCVPRWDANPERIRVESDAQPGTMALEVTSGAMVTNLTGPLDYAFRTYTILPDAGSTPMVSGIMAAVPVPVAGKNEFTVGSANLQRFYDTVNDPGVSDVALTPAAFARRLAKASLAIREVMGSPDIVGVEEVENLSTLQALAAQINADALAAGQPDPQYEAHLIEGNDVGGIDVGALTKASRVIVHDVAQEGLNATFINPNNGLPDILNDRPPLVIRATVLSMVGPNLPVTVIVNHLRSLVGIDDVADGARVRAKRAAQAEFLANLVQARQAANPAEEIVLVGDFNAFEFNDGYVDVMGTVKGMPAAAELVTRASPDLVNPDVSDLIETLPADARYTYVFGGNAQSLDHILVTGNLLGRLSRFYVAHNNADFPESYRSDGTRPERISDHDFPVAYFSLPPITVQVDIKPGDSTNAINLGSNGNVPVAILSSAEFDAGTVDPATVTLAGASVRMRGRGALQVSVEDVNGDGLGDLVLHIPTSALQLAPGATEATLDGMTFSGMFVKGKDTVRIVP